MAKTTITLRNNTWEQKRDTGVELLPPRWQFWRSGEEPKKETKWFYLYLQFEIDGKHISRFLGLLKLIDEIECSISYPMSEEDGTVIIGSVVEKGITYHYRVKFVKTTDEHIVFDVKYDF